MLGMRRREFITRGSGVAARGARAAAGHLAFTALWGGSAGKPFGGRCQREKVPGAGGSGQRVRNCDGAG